MWAINPTSLPTTINEVRLIVTSGQTRNKVYEAKKMTTQNEVRLIVTSDQTRNKVYNAKFTTSLQIRLGITKPHAYNIG